MDLTQQGWYTFQSQMHAKCNCKQKWSITKKKKIKKKKVEKKKKNRTIKIISKNKNIINCTNKISAIKKKLENFDLFFISETASIILQ